MEAIERIKLGCSTCYWDSIACAISSRQINLKALAERKLTRCPAWKNPKLQNGECDGVNPDGTTHPHGFGFIIVPKGEKTFVRKRYSCFKTDREWHDEGVEVTVSVDYKTGNLMIAPAELKKLWV